MLRRLVLSSFAAAALLGGPLAIAQTPAFRAPHRADGHPDLNGIWQAFVTANWDLQDHEAQPGPHPELDGRVRRRPPAGRASSRAARFRISRGRSRRRKQNFEKRDEGRRQQRQDMARARRSRN